MERENHGSGDCKPAKAAQKRTFMQTPQLPHSAFGGGIYRVKRAGKVLAGTHSNAPVGYNTKQHGDGKCKPHNPKKHAAETLSKHIDIIKPLAVNKIQHQCNGKQNNMKNKPEYMTNKHFADDSHPYTNKYQISGKNNTTSILT